MKLTFNKLAHSPAAYIFGKVINYLLVLFIFGMIPVVLFIFITSRTPIIGGVRSFVFQTGSMTPSLPVGSMVFTIPLNAYKINDVITFKRGAISVTHRIVGFSNNKFITQGDANNSPDSQLVSYADVIGKNVVVVPAIGRFTAFIKTPLGFGALLGIPTLLFVLFEFLQIKKEWEKSIERRIMQKYNKPIIHPLSI